MQPSLPSLLQKSFWLPLGITIVVLAYGWWRNQRAGRKPRDVLAADVRAAQRIDDKIDR
jgi:hypothetical protein